ncbi:MAG: YraN family protein [Coriobacteriales bacterium]|nr:YraN family protein [Coriobacteriales bacterium]
MGDNKALGKRGEDAACAYLERVGMTIVERNWRSKPGEVDVVALDGETLVLCEVKTRKSVRAGTPEEAVTPAKQKRYERLAKAYVQAASIDPVSVRFDVVTILVVSEDRALLRHHRAAFVTG